MSAFIDFFTMYLRNEVTNALAAAPGRELRVFFSGPPSNVLDGVFSALLDGNEFLGIDEKSIPIFILDKNAKDPDRLRSARCSASHLVKVRTSACRVYLVLMPTDELTNVSIDTTSTWVGTKNAASDVETWMEHAMVRQLVDGALSRFFSGRIPDVAKQALGYAMSEAWELDEPHKDKRNTWRVLRRLYDCQPQGPVNEEAFLAILGLPKCDSENLGGDEHLKILGRIADLLDRSGLNSGFEILEEQADDELRPHVAEFRRHIFSECRMSSDFSLAAAQKYTPIKNFSQVEVPAWWQALTLASWNRLLDSPEPVTQPGLRVEFSKAITPDVRGLPVLLQDRVLIKVTPPDEATQISVSIKSASGARQLENKCTIDVDSRTDWEDSEVPVHDRYVRYELEAEGYKRGILKCIVLDQYIPGVSIYSRNATKITPFKLNRKAKDSQGRRFERYECELTLHGMGSHQLDFYKGSQVILGKKIIGYDVTSEQDGTLERAINPTDATHAVCIIEADEECYYDFEAKPASAENSMPYRILVTTEEQTPTGAASEFDRLLIEHRASANGESVSSRVEPATSRSADFEIWAIEGEDSFHPVVFGPDYLNAWQKPVWAERPIFSRHRLMLDPRPPTTEFVPPPMLVGARNRIRQFLRPHQDEVTNAVEMIQLAELMANADFANSVTEYLAGYVTWLQSDYQTAVWMDVISIHGIETNGDSLAPVPVAILLTPLHPLRLAWQCQAQHILKNALDRHCRCPGASVLDPCSFPDSILLPCRSATGRIEEHGFLSLASSSDYWSILWNKDYVPALGGTEVEKIFNYEFGILIEGLSTGFSVQQVMRSIEEVGRLSSAKSTLRVSIESDTSGSSSCNEGIDKWCSTNLGADGDAWYEAGPRSLHVYDYRPDPLQPEQASLASLTARSGATVRWFTPAANQERVKGDLAIVAHLGVASPGFQVEGLRGGIDPEALTRYRLRKQLPATSGAFIAESRVGSIPQTADPMTLTGLMLACVDKFESTCAQAFDSYVFAPKMPTLAAALDTARYCAVSSSTVDAACFFRTTNESYLWDYELPAYSRRAGENNGYYLLAKESPSIVEAVNTAVHTIAPHAKLEPAQISLMLQEISRRGMPTLKRLTGGGAASLGEIGMLVALRVLQSEFQPNPTESGLCPVRAGENILNLLIPADPFKNHFEDLQSAIHHRSGERPDLIVASIRIVAGKPVGLKLTPMEVKARSGGLAQTDRLAALSQATSFAEFLVEIQSRAKEIAIWGIAWRNLLASWLDYAFRVYGQLESFMRQQEWTQLHGQVLQDLMAGETNVEIDTRGRLIVIDNSNNSSPWDVDNDRFNETVVLTHSDAYSLLSGCSNGLLGRIRATLGDWSLSPSEQGAPTATPPPTPLASSMLAAVDIPHAPASTVPSLPDERPQPLPSQPVGSTPALATSNPAQAQVAIEIPAGIKFTVGSTVGTFQAHDVEFFPGNTELNQLNIGIVGDLGMGKTQLIQSLLYQIRARPESNRGCRPKVLIFDYKKDYSKRHFVEATGARVVNPFDIPLNMFDTRDLLTQRNAWLERSKFFADVLSKIYSGIGPLQRTRIKEAVRQSYERAAAAGSGSPTIYDVFDSYTAICNNQIDTPYSIMSDMVDGGYFERDPQKIQKFSDFLDGIVVVDLGALGQDDLTKNMLVVVFLNLFYEHMLKIEKKPFIGESPRLRFVDTMLLVDEANNIMKYEFDVLKRVLLQGREFGVGVILASQYLSHYKTPHENYCEPLLSWFVHKVPNITVRELEGVGLSRVDASLVERIKALACHECLYKSLNTNGEFIKGIPFYELIKQQT